jgi:hypothetical protein
MILLAISILEMFIYLEILVTMTYFYCCLAHISLMNCIVKFG